MTCSVACECSPRSGTSLPPWRRWTTGFLLALAAAATATAAPVTVPNGDFSDPANNGSINTATTAPLGTGPWAATAVGVVGLLPPTVAIGNGVASIQGLLSINVAGLLNNSGRLHVDTGTAWTANQRYVITVDVDANTVLGVGALTSGNIGVALATGTSPASRVASSASGSPVTLSLLSGSRYRITLTHETGASVSGTVFVHLFSEPSGVISANLLTAVTFDNVALSTQLLTQVPAGLVPGNPGPYSAVPGGPVTPSIAVTVVDALGDPIPGVQVTFTAPSTGASATVTPNPALTDTSGTATVTAIANTFLGTYTITASVPGLPVLSFSVQNVLPGDVTLSTGESSLNAEINGQFSCVLLVKVTDNLGEPYPGLIVDFVAPTSGPSAVLTNETGSGLTLSSVTDGDGFAWVEATANTLPGTYVVTADVRDALVPAFEFRLRNLAVGDPLHASGFDGPCIRPSGSP